MSREEPQGFWGVVAGFFRFLFTLIFVIAILVGIAAALYYGVPWVYQNVIDPIQNNSARIAALEQQMETMQEARQDDLHSLQEALDQTEADLTDLQEKLAAQVEQLEALETRVQRSEKRITQLEGTTSSSEAELALLEEQIKQMSEQLGMQTSNLQEMETFLQARLLLLQSTQDLLHARLLLLEDNPRGARDALTAAREHLQGAAELIPLWQSTLDDFIAQTETLDQLVAEHSFRAVSEMESLWAAITDFATVQQPAQTAESPLLSPRPTPTPPAP